MLQELKLGSSLSDRYVAVNNENQFVPSVELNRQIKHILQSNRTPILYLNETVQQLPLSFTEWLANRLTNIFAEFSLTEISQVILAYYPQWIIGQLDQPQTWRLMLNTRLIREVMTDLYGKNVGRQVRLVYLGSQTDSIMDEVKDRMQASHQALRK